jgi:hypothetical protein
VPLDAKDFLAGIIAFAAGAVGVFDACSSRRLPPAAVSRPNEK